MTDEPALELDATAQAELIREGTCTPAELLDAALQRIDRVDHAINAVVIDLSQRAHHRLAQTAPTGPFAGVPILLKDACQELEGTPHWIGTRALHQARWRSRRTTVLAQRFESAGFVIAGRTNVPELSIGATTEPEEFGPTRNPWDPKRTVGGSSGGSAAAVAAGIVAVAHGSDATGSLRYPASCCGLVTLKPTRGRVPSLDALGADLELSPWTEFVMARTTRDLRGVFNAVTDPTRGGHGSPGVASLSVGLLLHDPVLPVPVEAECRAAVNATGTLLEAAGHRVSVTHPPQLERIAGELAETMAVLIPHERAMAVAGLECMLGRALLPGEISAAVSDAAAEGRALDPAAVEASRRRLQETLDPIASWWNDHDLLVTPTMRRPPWRLGRDLGALDVGIFPMPYSFTGQPALSVPIATSRAGLPIGVQIVGRHGADDLLLTVAATLESVCGWAERRPDLSWIDSAIASDSQRTEGA